MESKDELKEIDIKNHTRYYFDDVMRYTDINSDNILLRKNSYKKCEIILICDISYETFMFAKPLRISFNKIDGFMNIYDGTRYLVLCEFERYNVLSNRIKYLINEKGCIINSINHNFTRIRIDSYNSLPKENFLTFHNVILLIKSASMRIKMTISIIYF